MTNGYGKLIQRVRKVNRKAAIIMARQLPLLKQRGLLGSLTSPENWPVLAGAFWWAESPQGDSYWREISKQLGE